MLCACLVRTFLRAEMPVRGGRMRGLDAVAERRGHQAEDLFSEAGDSCPTAQKREVLRVRGGRPVGAACSRITCTMVDGLRSSWSSRKAPIPPPPAMRGAGSYQGAHACVLS